MSHSTTLRHMPLNHYIGMWMPWRTSQNLDFIHIKVCHQRSTGRRMNRNMTTKLCPHLTAFVMLMLAVGLSSRISNEVRREKFLGTISRFAHLFAFGTWLGIQFWATFIAGKSFYLINPYLSLSIFLVFSYLLYGRLEKCRSWTIGIKNDWPYLFFQWSVLRYHIFLIAF